MEFSPPRLRERPQHSPLGPRRLKPQTSMPSLDVAVQQAQLSQAQQQQQHANHHNSQRRPTSGSSSSNGSVEREELRDHSSSSSSPTSFKPPRHATTSLISERPPQLGQLEMFRSSSLQSSPVAERAHDDIHCSPSLTSPIQRVDSVKRPQSASSTYATPKLIRIQPANSKPPTLPPPPNVRFEAVGVEWKGLPLEAALWTFTSQELQQTVSRAIRSSANESFIRLLPLQHVDTAIPAEIERLRILKATTSSRYRFCVQRRTMLLQALNSASANPIQDGGQLFSTLAMQLAENTGETDRLADELVKITDQLGQLSQLLDVHWSSALAIALRKLNGSYGKRTADLQAAKDRITQLESELDDAWKEAKTLAGELDRIEAQRAEEALAIANEMVLQREEEEESLERALDGLDAFGGEEEDLTEELDVDMEEGTAIIGTAEVVSLRNKPSSYSLMQLASSPPPPQTPLTPTYNIPLTVVSSPVRDTYPDDIPRAIDDSETEDEDEEDDKVSIISKRTTRSRVDQVEAAQKRSVRTSMGSLRFPASRKDSIDENVPPLPRLSKAIIQHASHVDLRPQRASFLSLETTRNNSVLSANSSLAPVFATNHQYPPRRRVSINDIELVDDYQPNSSARRRQQPYHREHPRAAVDDIIIIPRTSFHEIEEVPRAAQRRSVDETTLAGAGAHYREQHGHLQQNIPSIWQMAEAPKTPAERVEMMMNMKGAAGNGKRPSSSGGAYKRFKTFTQRYSLLKGSKGQQA